MTAARMYSSSCQDEMSEMIFRNNIDPHLLQMKLNDKFNESEWMEIQQLSPIHKLAHQLPLVSLDNSMTYAQHIKTLS